MRIKPHFWTLLAGLSLVSFAPFAQEMAPEGDPRPPLSPADQVVHADWAKLSPAERVAKKRQWQEKWKAMTPEEKKRFKETRRMSMEERRNDVKTRLKNTTPAEKEKIKTAIQERQKERMEKNQDGKTATPPKAPAKP